MNFQALPVNLCLRSATPKDEDFLAVLYRSCRPDLLAMAGEPQLLEHILAMQQRVQIESYRKAFPAASVLIVEHCCERIGRLVLGLSTSELRLIDIALLPQAQGQGHGKALLRSLQEQAAAYRVPLRLSVNPANHRARQLYLGHGLMVEQSDVLAEAMVWHPQAA